MRFTLSTSFVLTLTKPAGVTLAATFLVHHGGFATFGTQVSDLHGRGR